MGTTTAQRVTQLQSIVNELTARVAADSTNMDLPPLLATAQAELTGLQTATTAADTAAADKAAAADAAKTAAAAVDAAKAAVVARTAAAAAITSAPTPAPGKATSFRKAASVITPPPLTIPASVQVDTRPSPAARRPAPVAGTSRSGA